MTNKNKSLSHIFKELEQAKWEFYLAQEDKTYYTKANNRLNEVQKDILRLRDRQSIQVHPP